MDPKLLRARKLGRDWNVKVAPDKVMRKCSACMCKLWPGEAVIVIHHHEMHRQCLKEWLEATYAKVPPQDDEVERHLAGSLTVVETQRLQREFQEYRDALLDRLKPHQSAGHTADLYSS